MSDYRYQIVQRNGIACIKVMIDADPIAETHIPLDDILRSALQQGWTPPSTVTIRTDGGGYGGYPPRSKA